MAQDVAQDGAQHRHNESAAQTYEGFVFMMKWSTIVTVVAVAIIVLLISG